MHAACRGSRNRLPGGRQYRRRNKTFHAPVVDCGGLSTRFFLLSMPTHRANSRPDRSRTLEVRGLRFHVRCWPGTAAPLKLFLHGWLDLSATWQPVIDALPRDWNIAAPDQRGFGLSQAQGDTYWFYDYLGDLDGLLDQLSPDVPVDLIGHSMGSQVAALYAGVRPERIRRLVAMDGFYLPVQPPDRAPKQLRRWLGDLKQEPVDHSYASLDELAARIAKRQPGLDEHGARFVAECWSRQGEDGRYRLLGDWRHRQHGALLYRDEEAKAIFREVKAPTLLLDGEKSHLANLGTGEFREQRLACFGNARQVTIPGAGHMLHFDAPAAAAEAIADFLDAD